MLPFALIHALRGIMTTLKINIIGAGKLGKTIARLLVINKVGIIEGVCNRSLESSNTAVQFIGQGKAYATIADLPSADIVFITTSDDLIEHLNTALAVLLTEVIQSNSITELQVC